MAVWRKSSFAARTALEVDQSGRVIRVRSNRRPFTVIWVDADEWRDFVAGVKAGEFDPQPPPKAA